MSFERYEQLWTPQPDVGDETNTEAYLRTLETALARGHARGYPAQQDRLVVAEPDSLSRDGSGQVILPEGPHYTPWSGPHDVPTPERQEEFRAQGVELDSYGRPLHPLWRAIIARPAIGAVLGSGWEGRLYEVLASDVMVVAQESPESEEYVAMLQRTDTGERALPGGHIDPGETARQAALRELGEELGLVIPDGLEVTEYFSGPIADIRSTIHALHVTTAHVVRLPYGPLPALRPQPGEAKKAMWVPRSALEAGEVELFGGHPLLVSRGFRRLDAQRRTDNTE